MDAGGIIDKESFRAWLDALPAEVGEEKARTMAVWLASRCALRVLPPAWEMFSGSDARKGDPTPIMILRLTLIPSVAAVSPTDKIKAAATSADDAFAFASADFFSSSASAAQAATRTATATSKADAFGTAAAAAFAAADASGYASPRSPAAVAEAYAVAWASLSVDARFLADGNLATPPRLWHGGVQPFDETWQALKATATPDWQFWIDWYDDILAGRPQNWPMLAEIALIDPKHWDAGPDVVNPMIAEIVAKYRTAPAIELFTTTLYDFRFDALRHVMLAVPLPQDWQKLDDPAGLSEFLTDAVDLREDIATLCSAFAAEGTGMQGGGMARVYLQKILDEMANAETLGALRVGKLVEWGSILENTAAREDTRREFGPMADPFQMVVGKLKDLIRNHFAHTLARFSTLREIRMEDEADPWQVLRDLRMIVEALRSGSGGQLPPLDGIDIAVLDDVIDSIDRKIRELEGAVTPEVRSSLKREIDFQMAKVSATAGVYFERAKKAVKVGGESADTALLWEKRGQGLWGLIRFIGDKLGPPP